MNPYDPILEEIANGMLETAGIKPNYSDEAMLNSTIIFQSVLIDKIYNNQDYDNMDILDRFKMVEKAGEDLRKLIHTYTGLDTIKLANK
jgi:hypothetical protein